MPFYLSNKPLENTLACKMTELWAQTVKQIWTAHVIEKAVPDGKNVLLILFSTQRAVQCAGSYVSTICERGKAKKLGAK